MPAPSSTPTSAADSPRGSWRLRPTSRFRSIASPFARSLARALVHLIACLSAWSALSAVAADVPASPATLTEAQKAQVLEEIKAVGRRGFLYEVSRPTDADDAGRKKLFLYGTIHLGRIGSEPFNAPLLRALQQSTRLALEADPTDNVNTQALATELGQYRDGDGLQRHVPAALMVRVRAFAAKNGMPADHVGRFKPWLLANMVSLTEMNSAGLDPMLGSELYLSGFARGMQMPIVEIEGVEAQLRLLAGLPDAMQTAQLDEALTELGSNEAQAETKALFDLWFNGDRSAGDALIAELHREAKGRTFEQYFVDDLIDRRNRTMADQAEHYLERPGNTFFAVGSLHLFGEAGLIREFERRGYRVVDLQSQPLAQ